MKSRGLLFAGVVMVGAMVGHAAADVLVMNSGERREGRVEEIPNEPQFLRFITGSSELRVPRSMVREIIEQEDWVDYTILGNQSLRARQYDRAIQRFQQALGANADYGPAREGLDQARRMIEESREEQARMTTEANAAALGDIRDLVAQARFDQAAAILEQVKNTATSEDQRAAVGVIERDLYLAWAKHREDRLDTTGAEMHLQRVLRLDPNNREAQDLLLKVWEADPTKREQLLEVYEERLAENPNDIELNRKRADLLIRLNRQVDAIDSLLLVHNSGNFRAQGYDRLLYQAMERRSSNYQRSGDLASAIGSYRELMEVFPNVERTPLVILEYQKRIQDLEEDDWEGRAALLDNLVDAGLRSMALAEAERILARDEENERATALLRGDAEDRLSQAERAMREGNYYLARSLAQNFARQNTRFQDLTDRASDLFTEANVQAERLARQQRDQAREVVAMGDQYLAEARRYTELYKSADNPNRTGVISYRIEAERFADRAVETYRVALELDPSTADLVGGLDVRTKITDAERLKASLNQPTPRVFFRSGTSRTASGNNN